MTYELIMETKLEILKKNVAEFSCIHMENGQRMSLKLYSPALARTAGEKTREPLSDAYAVISPHPFTLGLFHSVWNIHPATGTENDQTDKQTDLGFCRAAAL